MIALFAKNKPKIYVGVVVLGLILGCGKTDSTLPPAAANPVRHDIPPIAKRLPALGQLQAVSWTAVSLSQDTFPSPPVIEPVYQVRGIAALERANVDRLLQNYAWQSVPTNQWPTWVEINVSLNSAEWVYDEKFTKDIAGSLVCHALYLDRKQGVVYFDLEVR